MAKPEIKILLFLRDSLTLWMLHGGKNMGGFFLTKLNANQINNIEFELSDVVREDS